MQETAKIVEESGLWEQILEARKLVNEAEDNLLKYALDIIPHKNAHEKHVLQKAVKTDYTTRKKVIDLILKLDTTTIKR